MILEFIISNSVILLLSASIIIDLIISELPNSIHPVVLMGNYISFMWKRRPVGRQKLLIVWGGLLVLFGIILFGTIFFIKYLPLLFNIIIILLILPNMFSIRKLFKVSKDIEVALKKGEIEEARKLTSYHLVSRDTSSLSESEISCCVIESISENMTDSITSPILYYLTFGITGAVLCRFINTADAMIGYRYSDYEYGGKIAARIDDIINYIPSRISLVFLSLSSLFICINPIQNIIGAIKGSKKTASPNAGITMGATAYGFGLNLSKKECYNLNSKGRKPTPKDIKKVRKWIILAVVLQLATFLSIYYLLVQLGVVNG